MVARGVDISYLSRTLLLCCVLLGCVPGVSSAATGATPLSGTITITGTGGKDDLQVVVTPVHSETSSAARLTIDPAATITATSGACPPETDPVNGRPLRNDCTLSSQTLPTLVIDLGAGDDLVVVDDPEGETTSARVSGGLGNDVITLIARGDRTIKGDDGDDELAAGGPTAATASHPVVYDGGAGTDVASFAGNTALTSSGTGQAGGFRAVEVGVNASLETKSAALVGINQAFAFTTFRTDTLLGIEVLSGTGASDVLTGAAGPDTLLGGDGNDNLRGGEGDDNLQGGDDLDNLVGGKGSDSVDGGPGIDVFPPDSGGDTFNTRDGYAEDVTCVKSDVIVSDLVDKVSNKDTSTAATCSVSIAAAKHLYDTKLSGRPARIDGKVLATRVRCPALKTEACEGKLEALLGRHAIGHADYKVRPGNKVEVKLPIGTANARKAAGKDIVLSAKEVDADGRDRFVSRPTRVAKTSG
jgi:Ca2+-binding RTX toxin-like protein